MNRIMTIKPPPPADPNPLADQEKQAGSVPRWIAALAAVVLAVVLIVIVYGYLARPGWIGVADKKFWDYLELLIVPAALAIGVYLLNRAQREREREAENAQHKRELEIQNQRTQDGALEAYLGQMSQLLLDKERPLRSAQPGEATRSVAQARTLTVLTRLNSHRKGHVVRFLYESGVLEGPEAVVSLAGADLSGANLSGATLSGADLRETALARAHLGGAGLDGANLSDADLSEAVLALATLSGANLSNANLVAADLTYASGWTEEQLTGANFLANTTMPDGRTLKPREKYEDWLKSAGSGEDDHSSQETDRLPEGLGLFRSFVWGFRRGRRQG